MNEKKQYKVLNPIAHGGRVERGEIVSLTESEAANFGPDYVSLVGAEPQAQEAKEEVPLDEMSLPELKDKAKELGLAVSGSKADLIERINLKLA